MPYGLGSWKRKLMPEAEAFRILNAAWEKGITTLDTSPEYGLAEERVFRFMKENSTRKFHIISKMKIFRAKNILLNLLSRIGLLSLRL